MLSNLEKGKQSEFIYLKQMVILEKIWEGGGLLFIKFKFVGVDTSLCKLPGENLTKLKTIFGSSHSGENLKGAIKFSVIKEKICSF